MFFFASFLSNLSASLIANLPDKQRSLVACFPHFVWLIRDHNLQMTDEKGNVIEPTEYLKTRVLLPNQNGVTTDQDCIIGNINRLFPTIECHTLPRPSADKRVIKSMATSDAGVNPEFIRKLVEFRDVVLKKLEIKRFSDQQCNSGLVMAAILVEYVKLINSESNIVPGDTYTTAMKGMLHDRSQKLVKDYELEMKQLLEGKYPMEEDDTNNGKTLLSYHERVMEPMLRQFESEIDIYFPTERNRNIKETLMSSLVDGICEATAQDGEVKVVGGKLCMFLEENFEASEKYCRELSQIVFREFTNEAKNAGISRNPVDLGPNLLHAEDEYFSKAVGPAKNKVYAKKRDDIDEICRSASSIPHRPFHLHISGTDKDTVILQWEDDGKYDYEIQWMMDGKNWKSLPTKYQEKSATINKLKNITKYYFRVRGTSEDYGPGHWSDEICANTAATSFHRGLATLGTFVGASVLGPLAALATVPIGGPLSLACGLVASPVLARYAAGIVATKLGPTGDLANMNSEEKSGK